MNANVKYRLSAAGQKAALIAGKMATSIVAETMEFSDSALIDKMTIGGDGSINYDRSMYGWPELDAPPADLAGLITSIDAYIAAKEADRAAKEVAEKEAARIKAEADFPLVEGIIAELNALPLDGELPRGIETTGERDRLYAANNPAAAGTSNYRLVVTTDQRDRINARLAEMAARREQIKAEADAAKKAALEAMIAEHGGIVFPVDAGMCKFSGQALWLGGQSKRWVGVFTAPKGIDSFCDSPRGEFVFSVDGLNRGDCIQGAGYDTNSRGKRRSETEWFGVVVRRDEESIVVDMRDSRAATLAASRKLK